MRLSRLTTVKLLIMLALIGSAHGTSADRRPYVAGELLVKYKIPADTQPSGTLLRAAGVTYSRAIGKSPIHRVILHADTSVEEAVAAYANDPNVEFVEPNYILYAQTWPDDVYYEQQWGLHNTGQVVNGYAGTPGADIDAQNAWEITSGSNMSLVAIVDTGCDLVHPDFWGQLWTNPAEIADNGIDDDGNGYVDDVHGWDFLDNDNTPQDTSGHGAHVAGIIAATTNNSRGITGVSMSTRILPLRFMNTFSQGTTSDAIQAIEYAIAQGAKIINCSWGGSQFSVSLYNTMANSDALFVCAAGNNAADIGETPFYPAGFDLSNVIAVAASDQNDQLCWFSNYSATQVDVTAPGVRIFGLKIGRRTLWSEDFEGCNLDQMPGWTTGGNQNRWAISGPLGFESLDMLALSPNGDYENNADTWVQFPVLDLSEADGAVVSFNLIGKTQTGSDRLYLEISTDAQNWQSQPLMVGSAFKEMGISGTLTYFSPVTADLGPWDHAPQLYLRFHFQSDASETDDGYYIDDIVLQAAEQVDGYHYMQGTSMAAGCVSGIAAMIYSENAALDPVEIRTRIEDSVDVNENLIDFTVSGGRVNAYHALSLHPEPALQDKTAENTSPSNAAGGSGSSGGGGGGGCFINNLR